MAGQRPKTIPTHTENETDKKTENPDTKAAQPANFETAKEIRTPRLTPKNPPSTDKADDSIKNCNKTAVFVAPIAFLNPISLVLSLTLTSIIFIIPIPPTIKEMPATDLKA